MIAATVGCGGPRRVVIATASHAQASQLQQDVDRLTATLGSAGRSAHLRAGDMAASPMVRADIETDAATMTDLAASEDVFSITRGEELEVFQRGPAAMTSLLRLPADEPSLAPLAPAATRVSVRGDELLITASEAIDGPAGTISGELVLQVPVDLTAVKRSLAGHAVDASLEGAGPVPLVMVPHLDGVAAGATVKLPLGSSAPWVGALTVVARPIERSTVR